MKFPDNLNKEELIEEIFNYEKEIETVNETMDRCETACQLGKLSLALDFWEAQKAIMEKYLQELE